MDAATKAKSEKRVVYVGTSVLWPGMGLVCGWLAGEYIRGCVADDDTLAAPTGGSSSQHHLAPKPTKNPPPPTGQHNTGGLAEDCTEEMLHAAFIPFGDIVEVTIPKDFKESKCGKERRFILNAGVRGGRAGERASASNPHLYILLTSPISYRFCMGVCGNENAERRKASTSTDPFHPSIPTRIQNRHEPRLRLCALRVGGGCGGGHGQYGGCVNMYPSIYICMCMCKRGYCVGARIHHSINQYTWTNAPPCLDCPSIENSNLQPALLSNHPNPS